MGDDAHVTESVFPGQISGKTQRPESLNPQDPWAETKPFSWSNKKVFLEVVGESEILKIRTVPPKPLESTRVFSCLLGM